MTEKARKIWLRIGNKWNDIMLGKEHINAARGFGISLSVGMLCYVMAITGKTTKHAMVRALIPFTVFMLLNKAGSDAIDEEIRNDLIDGSEAIREALNK